MNIPKFAIILLLISMSSVSFAAPPILQRVSPFQISGLDSISFDELKVIDFYGKDMVIPAQVAWTHRMINDLNKYTVLLWDPFSNLLLAWFLEQANDEYNYVGFDTLNFVATHFYKGAVQIEEPLVAPNNFSDPDSLVTSFLCLDKSFAVCRRFMIDWDSSNLSIDTTYLKRIGFHGGPPEHSFYTTGLANGDKRGIIVYQKILERYLYLTTDPNYKEILFKNQSEFLPYRISDIATLATGSITDVFFVIDSDSRYIYHNRLGIDLSEDELESTENPLCSPPYPAHLFTEELNSDQIMPTPMPWENESFAQPRNKHIEVDCDAHIWFNTLRSDKICLIKDAFYRDCISDFTDADTCYVIDLPKQLLSRTAGIKDIDGTVKGYLTITYFNGIETYKVSF